MMKKILILAIVVLFSFQAQAKKGTNIFAYSRDVPKSAIYNPYGQKVDLNDFKGEVILAVFWSRYCVPCVRELDDLNNFVNKTKDSGIRAIIISPAEEWVSTREQKELLAKYKAPDIEFYVDKGSKLAADFGIFAWPHTVLINKNSREFGRISGAVDWDDEDVIEELYKLKVQYGERLPNDDK